MFPKIWYGESDWFNNFDLPIAVATSLGMQQCNVYPILVVKQGNVTLRPAAKWLPVASGLLQGTVLEPLLFLIYIRKFIICWKFILGDVPLCRWLHLIQVILRAWWDHTALPATHTFYTWKGRARPGTLHPQRINKRFYSFYRPWTDEGLSQAICPEVELNL